MIYDNTSGSLVPLAGTPTARLQAIEDNIAVNENVYGAKNLLENTASTKTINGITFTVNNDGSVTTSGTSTADFSTFIIGYVDLKVGEKYIVSSGANGESGKYYVRVHGIDTEENHYQYDKPIEFTAEQTHYWVNIRIYNGIDMDNVTFYPMLRLASIADNTYVPYAMTNKELTDKYNITTQTIELDSFDTSKVSAVSNCNYGVRNGVCTFRIQQLNFTSVATSGGADQVLLPTNTLPKPLFNVYGVMVNSQRDSILLTVSTDGRLIVNLINGTTAGSNWNNLTITYLTKEV